MAALLFLLVVGVGLTAVIGGFIYCGWIGALVGYALFWMLAYWHEKRYPQTYPQLRTRPLTGQFKKFQ